VALYQELFGQIKHCFDVEFQKLGELQATHLLSAVNKDCYGGQTHKFCVGSII
jgi:hypothetical protein